MFLTKINRYFSQSTGLIISAVLLSAVALSAIQSSVQGIEKKTIQVVVDNEKIQRYNGLIGRWVYPGSTSISSLAEEFGTTVNRIREVNGGEITARSYMFIPMSRDRYNEFLKEGEGRRIFEVDPRKFLWPVEKPGYTSRFGMRYNRMHEGLDISAAIGTVVFAARPGQVIKVGDVGAMGRAIAVHHDNGMETWYGHNSILLVKEGDKVEQGQILSFSGNTGRSTGPHLHFEVRYLNISMNPEDFLPYGYARPDLVIREGDFITQPVPDQAGEESALNHLQIGNNLHFVD